MYFNYVEFNMKRKSIDQQNITRIKHIQQKNKLDDSLISK